jgi:hypothetical protein
MTSQWVKATLKYPKADPNANPAIYLNLSQASVIYRLKDSEGGGSDIWFSPDPEGRRKKPQTGAEVGDWEGHVIVTEPPEVLLGQVIDATGAK